MVAEQQRYLPPTRTSISQERRNMPIDFGALMDFHEVQSAHGGISVGA